MKLLITLLTLLAITVSAQAETSQILRQTINPAHLNPETYHSGNIELSEDGVKLILFTQENAGDPLNEVIINATVYEAGVNDCNDVTYYARTLKGGMIILTDRTDQTCDDVVLRPVVAEYTTLTGDNEFISRFEGSRFVSLSQPTGTLKVGNTLNLNYASPTIVQIGIEVFFCL